MEEEEGVGRGGRGQYRRKTMGKRKKRRGKERRR